GDRGDAAGRGGLLLRTLDGRRQGGLLFRAGDVYGAGSLPVHAHHDPGSHHHFIPDSRVLFLPESLSWRTRRPMGLRVLRLHGGGGVDQGTYRDRLPVRGVVRFRFDDEGLEAIVEDAPGQRLASVSGHHHPLTHTNYLT